MDTSRDEAENNDSLKDLPAVNIQSTSSGSNTKSEPQPKKDVTTKKKKTGGKKKNGAPTKKQILYAKHLQKLKLAQEKENRIRAHELNKLYRSGESKHIEVIMHPLLLTAWFTVDVMREVRQMGAKIVPMPNLCDPRLVMWKRWMGEKFVARNGQVALSPLEENCGHGLYILTMEEMFHKIVSGMLSTHMRFISEAVNNIRLTLVVFGSRDYFKSNGKKPQENKYVKISEVDLEKAITDLLVSTGFGTILINEVSELAMLISQSTKAIDESLFRRIKLKFDSHFDFYIRGENKKCVAVDKDGNGLGNLWQQMISVLPLCSLETSRALCSHYKTPLALYETLAKEGAKAKIANLGVKRSAAAGCKARRIGPEFAKKLHILFTAEDGNALVE